MHWRRIKIGLMMQAALQELHVAMEQLETPLMDTSAPGICCTSKTSCSPSVLKLCDQ